MADFDDNAVLRKRTQSSISSIERVGRPRERSVDPGVRKRVTIQEEIKTDTLADDWELFKESIYDKYPNIKFPDEYFDNDIVSASITGIDANLTEILGSVPKNVTFNVQKDGRVIVEFKKPERVPVKIKIMLPSKNTLIVFAWLLCLVGVSVFIKLNLEKYKRLMWT